MIIGTRRGTVRFYGNGPIVKPATAKWFYEGAKQAKKTIGEFMNDIAESFPTKKQQQPYVERHDDDDAVPLTP